VLERIAVPLTEVRGLKPSRGPAVGGAADQPDDRGACAADRGPVGFLQTGAQALLRMMLAQCLAPAVSEEREGRT
jgi:hypothetical protein